MITTLMRRWADTAWARLRAPVRTARRLRGRHLAITVAILAAGAGTWLALNRLTGLPPDAAFRIGDRIVTEDALNDRVGTLKALYGVQPPPDDRLDDFHRDVAASMAVSAALQDQAQQRHITVPDKEVHDTLAKFIAANFRGGRPQFIDALARSGTSEPALREEVKLQMVVSRLYGDVTKDVSAANEADLRNAYDQQRKTLIDPERRHILNVVLPSQQQARSVAERMRSGSDLTAIARAESIDGASRDRGGDLGEVTADQLQDAYSHAAFTAQVGQVFGPIQTENGWNVGTVIGIVPARPLSFDESKTRLQEQIESDRKLAIWRSWTARAMRTEDAEYADAYRPNVSDSARAQPPNQLRPDPAHDPAEVTAPQDRLRWKDALPWAGALAAAIGCGAVIRWWQRGNRNPDPAEPSDAAEQEPAPAPLHLREHSEVQHP